MPITIVLKKWFIYISLDEVDSDDEPSKNVVPDNPPPPVLAEIPEKTVHVKAALKEIDKMQQEAKAAEMRARMTLEERQQEFTKMMLERGVSAFSTWEKELPKIVFDPRYNYLNPKERKQAYDSFILTRAEDERKEKKAKLKEIRDAYRKMMEEFKVTPRYIEAYINYYLVSQFCSIGHYSQNFHISAARMRDFKLSRRAESVKHYLKSTEVN